MTHSQELDATSAFASRIAQKTNATSTPPSFKEKCKKFCKEYPQITGIAKSLAICGAVIGSGHLVAGAGPVVAAGVAVYAAGSAVRNSYKNYKAKEGGETKGLIANCKGFCKYLGKKENREEMYGLVRATAMAGMSGAFSCFAVTHGPAEVASAAVTRRFMVAATGIAYYGAHK